MNVTFVHTFVYEFVTLFVIPDPVATLPVFLAATIGLTRRQSLAVAAMPSVSRSWCCSSSSPAGSSGAIYPLAIPGMAGAGTIILGRSGIEIVSRVFGLILCSIAVSGLIIAIKLSFHLAA